jgi:hypothetical protein
MPEKDSLKAFQYDELAGHLQETPALVASGTRSRPPDGMPGGHSSLSANADHNGIIWTSLPTSDGQWLPAHGVLAAFDATTLRQIWVDEQQEWFAKFNPPTIADGKVFRAVFAQYALAGGRHIAEHHDPAQPLDDDGSAPLEINPGKLIIYGIHAHGIRPPHIRQWRSWIGGGDPAPHMTLREKRNRHLGSGPFVAIASDEQRLPDGGQRQEFTGWVTASRGSVSVRFDHNERVSCDNPPRTTYPINASIFWSEATGAHIVLGEIRDAYLDHDGPAGPLGYPTSDERPDAEHPKRISRFERGAIVWDPTTGAHVLPD